MRRFEDIAADFDALAAGNFDYTSRDPSDWDRLDRLCDEILAVKDASRCAPVLLRTIERLDGVDLGAPGPLVHTLESWRGLYEPFLVESIRRKPSELTVWMVNRILNSKPANAAAWLDLLRSVATHPAASASSKEKARHFLKYQMGT